MNHHYQDPDGFPMMTMQRGNERIWGSPWDWGFGGPFFRPWGYGRPFFPFFLWRGIWKLGN